MHQISYFDIEKQKKFVHIYWDGNEWNCEKLIHGFSAIRASKKGTV